MKEYMVKIKSLTPIWTGDEERQATTLRETGIIGSLRWWYEALVRGLGGTACDPTSTKSDKRCPDRYNNHCDACELFGCTDWARKFRLEMNFDQTIPEVWIATREKRRSRYLKRNIAGFMSGGTINLKFIPLREIAGNEWALLNKALNIIAECGALGAHSSQGNGVIEIVGNNLPYNDKRPEKSKLKKSGDSVKSPDLNDFFFYKFQINFTQDISEMINKKVFWTHQRDDQKFRDNWDNWKKLWGHYHFLPIAFHIRDTIRHLEVDKNKRHEVFGRLGKGSKIFVSHSYKIDDKVVEARIWGYEMDNHIKNQIKSKLSDNLKEKFFQKEEYKEYLEECRLVEEKIGKEITGGLE